MVANGGARRSARIGIKLWTDTDIIEYIHLKRDNPWMWSVNLSILRLKTKNGLHISGEPFVVWLVLKEGRELVRLESAEEIPLPLPESSIYKVFMDGFGSDCEIFKAYTSSGSTDMMMFVGLKNEKPYIFEVPLKLTN